MRISKRPPEWDINDSIWHKRRAVVAAVRRADLQGDTACPRELGERVHVGGWRDGRIVERPCHGAGADLRHGEVLQLDWRIGRDEGVDGVHAPRRRAELTRGGLGALESDFFARAEEEDHGVLEL